MRKRKEQSLWIASIFLISLLFISLANGCEPSYTKDIKIRVADYNYRPINNAFVSIYYQVSSTKTKHGVPIYTFTPTKMTNKSGIVVIRVYNKEFNPSKVDCVVKAYVTLMDKTIVKKIDIDRMPYEVLIKLNASRVTFNIYENGKRVDEGIAVILNKTYNLSTTKYLFFPKGRYNVSVFYRYAKRSYTINTETDTSLDIDFRKVNVSFGVYDDRGNEVPYNITIGNEVIKEIYKIESGTRETVELIAGVYVAKVEALGREKEIPIDTTKKSVYEFSFDLHEPELISYKIKREGDLLNLYITAIDEGRFASGVKEVAIEATYPSANVVRKYMEKIAKDSYFATLPYANSIEIKITIVDNEGNAKIIEALYKAKEEVKEKESKGGYNIIWPIIILIVLAGLIIAGIYIKNKLEE